MVIVGLWFRIDAHALHLAHLALNGEVACWPAIEENLLRWFVIAHRADHFLYIVVLWQLQRQVIAPPQFPRLNYVSGMRCILRCKRLSAAVAAILRATAFFLCVVLAWVVYLTWCLDDSLWLHRQHERVGLAQHLPFFLQLDVWGAWASIKRRFLALCVQTVIC